VKTRPTHKQNRNRSLWLHRYTAHTSAARPAVPNSSCFRTLQTW